MKKLKSCSLIFLIALLAIAAIQFPWGANKRLANDTRPRTNDGFVDYLAIANERLKENVTVDNNVVVDIVQVFGPDHIHGENQNLFLELLGNPDIPANGFYQEPGSYLESVDEQFDMRLFYDEQHSRLIDRPWKDTEFPLVVAWLEQEKSNLDQLVQGSKKPYYFHPLCNVETGHAIGALLPYPQLTREGVRSLTIRAMNHVGNDRLEEALADLAAIRRIGKLIDQGPTLIEHLVGFAFVGIAFNGEQDVLVAMADGGELSESAIEQYRQAIRDTKMGLLGHCVRDGEEHFSQDTIQRLARGDAQVLSMIGQPIGPVKTKNITLRMVARWTNWEIAQKKCAAFYERIGNALDIEDAVKRGNALRDLEQELANFEAKAAVGNMALKFVSGANGRGELAGDILIGMLAPGLTRVDESYNRTLMYQISDLGFALELFRRENGEFPTELAALTPEFVKTIPTDVFNGLPLSYQKTETGYRLWSVGANGRNEQVDDDDNLIDWTLPEQEDVPFVDDIVIGIGGIRQ